MAKGANSKRKIKISAHHQAQIEARRRAEALGLQPWEYNALKAADPNFDPKPGTAAHDRMLVKKYEADMQTRYQEASKAMQEASGHTSPTELDRAMEANRSTRRNAPTPEDEMRLDGEYELLKGAKRQGITSVADAMAGVHLQPSTNRFTADEYLAAAKIWRDRAAATSGSAASSYNRKAAAYERRAASSSGVQPGTLPQDQRKAAEKRADASGSPIRPTAASSGKQAADPSIAAASQTTSQDKKKRSPKVGTPVEFKVKNENRSMLGTVTRKSSSGGTVYVRDVGGQIHVLDPEQVKRASKSQTGAALGVTKKTTANTPRKLSIDPKQVARRAKRGFPNGH